MKNTFYFILLFCFFSLNVMAQTTVQSSVFDKKNGQAIEMATVRLLHLSDSSFVQGCRTNSTGSFLFSNVLPGTYLLVISNVGFKEYQQTINVLRNNLILKSIQLVEDAKLLGEVEVKGTATQMVVKGDTLEYNATAFKTTQNAVVEDLLKRLPGVEVSSEGKITVNGEDIKKIRINGKKFFGDDVEMATKNIPAEMIEKIQVLDQKSDMALLTGFEDNDTERIINLTFKPNRKRGAFGKVTGGVGMDTNGDVRYDNNLFLNLINGEAQTTLTGGANNANTTRSSRGRGGFDNNSGITSTQNFGVNNNTIINSDFKIGGDGSFNHSNNDTKTESNRESYLKGSKYLNTSTKSSISDSYSSNFRLEMEWKIDSLNTLVFQPNISYGRSFSDSFNDYIYRTDSVITSKGITKNTGNGTTVDGGFSAIYSHLFLSKKGRTFTANFKPGVTVADNESFNYSKMTMPKDSIVDQRTNNHTDKYNLNLRLSFVEPLWNMSNFLESSISFRNTKNNSDKKQNNVDTFGIYSKENLDYSNRFESQFYSETVELNYRYVDKAYNVMLGMKGEPSQTYNSTIYGNGLSRPFTKEVFNFAPTARLKYTFGKKKFVRLDYRGQTDQPSVSQMQPVKNNSNLMTEIIGNPLLNPSFTNSLRVFCSTFNDVNFSSFNAMFSANVIKDALVSNSIYDLTGKQYNQTVNSGATPYSMMANLMYNTPIIQKRLHFNTNSSGGFQRQYGYSSKRLPAFNRDSIMPLGDLSNTRSFNFGEQISITYTDDIFELGMRAGLRYSNTLNNLNPVVATTKDWSIKGDGVVHLPNNFSLGSDLNFTNRQGYSNFDQNQLIWNATLDKTLFNGKGVLSIKAFDLLHQQKNIRQTIGDNYIQYNSYNTLTSYFLVSFTYKLNKFSGMKNPEDLKPDGERMHPENFKYNGGKHDHFDGSKF